LFSFPPPLASWNQISVVAAAVAASAACSPTQNSSTYEPEGGVFTQVWDDDDGDGDVDIDDFDLCPCILFLKKELWNW
jgi:hypothetical protein